MEKRKRRNVIEMGRQQVGASIERAAMSTMSASNDNAHS